MAVQRSRYASGVIVVCGIFPYRNVSNEQLFRAITMNSWLTEHGKINSLSFVHSSESIDGRKYCARMGW